jgi:hypothetical protein
MKIPFSSKIKSFPLISASNICLPEALVTLPASVILAPLQCFATYGATFEGS